MQITTDNLDLILFKKKLIKFEKHNKKIFLEFFLENKKTRM